MYNLLRSGREPAPCPAVARNGNEAAITVLKTHAPFRTPSLGHEFKHVKLRNARFIHVYRNPLDVLLSYINFTRIVYRQLVEQGRGVRQFQRVFFKDLLGFKQCPGEEEWHSAGLDAIPRENLDHALAVFTDGGMCIPSLDEMSGNWLEHTQSWLDAGESLPGVVLKYEDCLSDPRAMARIADHFVFERENVVGAVSRINAVLKRKRVTGGQNQKVFFNKMTAFYFQEYFSPHLVIRFMKQYADVLTRFGDQDLVETFS